MVGQHQATAGELPIAGIDHLDGTDGQKRKDLAKALEKEPSKLGRRRRHVAALSELATLAVPITEAPAKPGQQDDYDCGCDHRVSFVI